jgi:hypothetical protein
MRELEELKKRAIESERQIANKIAEFKEMQKEALELIKQIEQLETDANKTRK